VIGTGAVGVGTLGTLWHSRTANAVEIDTQSLDLPDYEQAGDIQEKLVVSIDSEVTYESDVQPDTLEIVGHAGAPNDLYELTSESIELTESTSKPITTTLEIDVLESLSLDLSQFQLLTGMDKRETDVQVQLEAILRESGSKLAEAAITETATITITKNSAEIGLSGTAEWEGS
jgi:hypothetical protein